MLPLPDSEPPSVATGIRGDGTIGIVSCSHFSSSSLGNEGEDGLWLKMDEVRYGECCSEGGIGMSGVAVNSLRDFRRGILFVREVDSCEGRDTRSGRSLLLSSTADILGRTRFCCEMCSRPTHVNGRLDQL